MMSADGTEWSHKMLGCFDNVGLCVLAFLLPCVAYGRNMQALGENCALCAVCFFVQPVGFAGGVWQRATIRQKAGIAGSLTGDILASLFCPCCALVQEAQELQEMGLAGQDINRQ